MKDRTESVRHQCAVGGGHIFNCRCGGLICGYLSFSFFFFFTLTLRVEGIFQSAERFISESNNQ